LCGGYQMLGRRIEDPDGVEGPPGGVDGLGLLDVTTVLTGAKRLAPASGTTFDGAAFTGYEMHMGRTTGPATAAPFAHLSDGPEGAVAGRILGSYIHGLFADDAQRGAWLTRLGDGTVQVNYARQIEDTLDALADHLEAHIPLPRLLELAR
jgi:adenosylcobyric acid synthase